MIQMKEEQCYFIVLLEAFLELQLAITCICNHLSGGRKVVSSSSQMLCTLHRTRHSDGEHNKRVHRFDSHSRPEHHSQLRRKLRAGLKLDTNQGFHSEEALQFLKVKASIFPKARDAMLLLDIRVEDELEIEIEKILAEHPQIYSAGKTERLWNRPSDAITERGPGYPGASQRGAKHCRSLPTTEWSL